MEYIYIYIYNLHSFLNHSLWFSKTQKPSIFDAKVTPEDLHLLLLLLDGPFRYLIRAFRPLSGPGSPAMEQTDGKKPQLAAGHHVCTLGLDIFFSQFFFIFGMWTLILLGKILCQRCFSFFHLKLPSFFAGGMVIQLCQLTLGNPAGNDAGASPLPSN